GRSRRVWPVDIPSLVDAGWVLDVDVGDQRAAMWDAADQVFPGQPLQRFADWSPPDLELVAQTAFLDHRAGRHVEADDAVSNAQVGLLTLGADSLRGRAVGAPGGQCPSLRSHPLL